MVSAQPPPPCAVKATETLASDQPNDEPDIKWLRETVLVEAARWWGAKAQDLISRCTDRLLSAGPQAVSQALLRRAAVDITIDAWCSARALLRGRLRAPQTNYVSLEDWQSEAAQRPPHLDMKALVLLFALHRWALFGYAYALDNNGGRTTRAPPAISVALLDNLLDVQLTGLSPADARWLLTGCPLQGFSALDIILFHPTEGLIRPPCLLPAWRLLRRRLGLSCPPASTIALAAYFGHTELLHALLPTLPSPASLGSPVTLGSPVSRGYGMGLGWWPLTGRPLDLAACQGYGPCTDLLLDYMKTITVPEDAPLFIKQPGTIVNQEGFSDATVRQLTAAMRRQSIAIGEPDRAFMIVSQSSLRLGPVLGAGAFGKVYRAEYRERDGRRRVVAVKALSLPAPPSTTGMGQEEEEEVYSQRLDMLAGEFVVALHFAKALGMCLPQEEAGRRELWVVSDLYSGTLKDHLSSPSDVRVEEGELQRRRVLDDVALELYRMHANYPAIVHGDLKADNVLVYGEAGGKKTARLADYGLASALVGGQDGLLIKHYPQYAYYRTAAPEVRAGGAYTPAADVYSFGCLIEEVFEGKPLPDDLRAIVGQCKEADPAVRPTIQALFVGRQVLGVIGREAEHPRLKRSDRTGWCYTTCMLPPPAYTTA